MHPHFFCHFLRKEYKQYSFIRMYIMFALNVTHFSNKPKDSNLFASYIAQRYATHKKGADQSLSGAPLVRMTLVFECMFSTPFLSNMPLFLASNCAFCFRCISLKQISNEFQLSLRLPLVERPIHWNRRALT